MRWLRRIKHEREQLERVEAALVDECTREKRVDAVMTRIEESRRRNHFGESIEIAMGKRRHA
ncbi:hypothetical protein GS894_02875 [Rhodococcus hoagii]|uniref:Uncharacterized protein n=1 Tax=Prescottella equi ATCC 33707 TaxID=525370 RepID=E9T0N3_RHOHA|nr:hypothetical protein [Prescottella equi]EGD23984.1 hypothetical protein HMPREF0724_12192 [Prescottella equi ATCC 33707]AVP67305.1 hypothetical protein C7H75_04680 [Prescottella equi]AVP67364.1 hypothetical protein C7H75_04995 [Prescottella equi]MBM4573120.1 hypothetical protein [Prescottella equi]NKR30305.1 hypothetical protein [Prescottella equi]